VAKSGAQAIQFAVGAGRRDHASSYRSTRRPTTTLTFYAGANPDLPGFNAQLHAEVRDCTSSCSEAPVLGSRNRHDLVVGYRCRPPLEKRPRSSSTPGGGVHRPGSSWRTAIRCWSRVSSAPLVDGATMKKTAHVLTEQEPRRQRRLRGSEALERRGAGLRAARGARRLCPQSRPAGRSTSGEIALVAKPYDGGPRRVEAEGRGSRSSSCARYRWERSHRWSRFRPTPTSS